MHREKQIVINTGPLIAIVAALGDYSILGKLYDDILVPHEVAEEILTGGKKALAYSEFAIARELKKIKTPVKIAPILLNSLDLGEAAVIQLALDKKIQTVCIDEAVGRRVARLNGLSITGTIGILLRAKREGHEIYLNDAIEKMQKHGIWINERLKKSAIELSSQLNT